MKELLVFVADADALAFMGAILRKPEAVGIRPVTFDIERHPLRDSGMVQTGAELVRMKKGRYQKALLMWDHHGSGRDHQQSPGEVREEIQGKLDSYTWAEDSAAVILVPELERWLWFCENAWLSHFGMTGDQLGHWMDEYSRKFKQAPETSKIEQPKELFEYLIRDRLRRTISPRDFEKIGERAGTRGLMMCESFRNVAEILRDWFPRCPTAF